MSNKLLFLPHCLKQNISDKLLKYGEEKNYDVYIVPGSSRVKKILNEYSF